MGSFPFPLQRKDLESKLDSREEVESPHYTTPELVLVRSQSSLHVSRFCCRIHQMASQDWSALLIDTISVVFSMLRLPDFIRCRAVCKSWNLAIIYSGCSPAPEPPWLMLPPTVGGDTLTFLSLSDNKEICRITLPDLRNRRNPIISVSNGHLILADREATELLVLNPFTGSRTHFPPICTMPNISSRIHFKTKYPMPPRQLGDVICSKAILSGTHPPSMAAIYDNQSELALASAGDESWAAAADNAFCGTWDDCIFHKGMLYVLSFYGDVLVSPNSLIKSNIQQLDYEECREIECYPLKFLVESTDGDLLQVWSLNYLNPDEEADWTYGLKPFVVFRLDASTNMWSMVMNLGEDVLMLGRDGCLCVSAREFVELRANCIYFTHMSSPSLGVFSLEDGSIEDHSLRDSQLQWTRRCWFTPSVSW